MTGTRTVLCSPAPTSVTPPPEPGDAPAGLLLAAGGGTRLGRPKALVPFRGEPLVRRGVRLLRRGGCASVTVVVGAAADEVIGLLAGTAVRIVENPDWPAGMSGSLRAGEKVITGAAQADS